MGTTLLLRAEKEVEVVRKKSNLLPAALRPELLHQRWLWGAAAR